MHVMRKARVGRMTLLNMCWWASCPELSRSRLLDTAVPSTRRMRKNRLWPTVVGFVGGSRGVMRERYVTGMTVV